jgi:hypothetical protein
MWRNTAGIRPSEIIYISGDEWWPAREGDLIMMATGTSTNRRPTAAAGQCGVWEAVVLSFDLLCLPLRTEEVLPRYGDDGSAGFVSSV